MTTQFRRRTAQKQVNVDETMDWITLGVNMSSTVFAISIASCLISAGVNANLSALKRRVEDVNVRVARIEGWVKGFAQGPRAKIEAES